MSADATLPDKTALSFPLPIESGAFGGHVALATTTGYVFYHFFFVLRSMRHQQSVFTMYLVVYISNI